MLTSLRRIRGKQTSDISSSHRSFLYQNAESQILSYVVALVSCTTIASYMRKHRAFPSLVQREFRNPLTGKLCAQVSIRASTPRSSHAAIRRPRFPLARVVQGGIAMGLPVTVTSLNLHGTQTIAKIGRWNGSSRMSRSTAPFWDTCSALVVEHESNTLNPIRPFAHRQGIIVTDARTSGRRFRYFGKLPD